MTYLEPFYNEQKVSPPHFKIYPHNHTMKLSITIARAIVIPTISLPPFAVLLVADVDGALAVPDTADAAVPEGDTPVADAVVAVAAPVWPMEGNAAFPLTSQPFGVDVGHAGVERLEAEAEYTESDIPVGVSVAHWFFRFVKSGEIGVGVPDRIKPPSPSVAVAANAGP